MAPGTGRLHACPHWQRGGSGPRAGSEPGAQGRPTPAPPLLLRDQSSHPHFCLKVLDHQTKKPRRSRQLLSTLGLTPTPRPPLGSAPYFSGGAVRLSPSHSPALCDVRATVVERSPELVRSLGGLSAPSGGPSWAGPRPAVPWGLSRWPPIAFSPHLPPLLRRGPPSGFQWALRPMP